MKQEDPCRGVMGEVKKKGNMAVLTLVRKNMDQDQNEGAKEGSERSWQREKQGSRLYNWAGQHIFAIVTRKMQRRSQNAKSAGSWENSEEKDGTCGREEVVLLQAEYGRGYQVVKK